MNAINAIARNIANIIYPVGCAACGKPLSYHNETGACEPCLARIKPIPRPYCIICGHALRSTGAACAECRSVKPCFSAARSAFLYEGVVKELVHAYKYKNRRSLAGFFAKALSDILTADAEISKGLDAITFVPLHASRMRERDFNQSGLIAEHLASEMSLKAVDALTKIKRTKNQNELPRQERLVNLRGAFKTRESKIGLLKDRRVLLVDDVMTTGATFNECSRALIEAGAMEVRCIAIARGA